MLFKLDSGPGRLGMNMIAMLRLLGFVLYPDVPNTTAVSQSVACWYSFIWWGGPGDWSISAEEYLPRRLLKVPVSKGLG